MVFLWDTNITHGLAVEYLRDEGYQGAEEGGQDANVVEGSDDFVKKYFFLHSKHNLIYFFYLKV